MKHDKQPSFEAIVAELESIVRDLDSSIGLEESLKKYEKGMELAKEAEKRLLIIENRFEKLNLKFDEPNPQPEPISNESEPDLTELPF